MATIVFLGATSSHAASSAASTGPVAVMPFKNLSGSAELDWLRVGMAETLISDLQKAGSRKVVERDQLDQALAEIALQSDSSGSDEAMAAKAGRLVGATTVVLGAFQTAGSRGQKDAQLRLTARFVDVETGVVQETAKVTGRISEVFSLQDQIVSRLTGQKPGSARGAKKPTKKPAGKKPSPEQTAEAFRVYSLSLSTSSAAEQVKYLKQAIALDPDFHYAADDLYALETRLRRSQKQADVAADAQASALLQQLASSTLSDGDKALAVAQTLASYSSSFRWEAMRRLAEAIYAMDLAPGNGLNPRELASYHVFLSLMMLKKTDLALQAGERHLDDFPTGTYAGSVRMQLNTMIQEQHRLKDAQGKVEAELQELEADIAELKENAPMRAYRLRVFAFRRCTIYYQGKRYDDAVEVCEAFARKYGADAQDGEQPLDRLARYFAAMSKAELGRFAEARADMNRLSDEDAAWARSMGVPSFLQTWPRD